MSAQQVTNEEIEVLFKTLQEAQEPLTVSQIRNQLPSGRFKLPEKQIAEILDDQLRKHRAYRFKPYGGKSDRYWTRSHEEYARETILMALNGNPLTRSELKKKTDAKLRDCSDDKRKNLLNELIKEGTVRKWPVLIGGRSELFSTRPPNSQFYIEHVLKSLGKKLGLSQAQLIDDVQTILTSLKHKLEVSDTLSVRPDQKDVAQIILDRMVQIKPAAASGALVSLTELRRAVKDEVPDKTGFDQAILRLADQESVALHYHDYPASLSQDELNNLVTDGRGNYYIGVALRL
jgi:hypothetical protein